MINFIRGFVHWYRNRNYKKEWLAGVEWAQEQMAEGLAHEAWDHVNDPMDPTPFDRGAKHVLSQMFDR
jgi:hypothetical protein